MGAILSLTLKLLLQTDEHPFFPITVRFKLNDPQLLPARIMTESLPALTIDALPAICQL
jgi:hypothetical protein